MIAGYLVDERGSLGCVQNCMNLSKNRLMGTACILARSTRSRFVRVIGEAGFTAKRTAIDHWGQGLGRRNANVRRFAQRSKPVRRGRIDGFSDEIA